ncbi:MAG: YebC/PmpR family DNA-binding transcriptional regulator [Gemmatimonadales bacterium]|jgi:YebC/PmpR family DNA-binding regulatory protein
MAGHSKWKQIKRKKAVTDAKRGAKFTKLIKEITVAARDGGGDPAGNARLRTAIDAAKAENMPADNIERAIKKGTGELEGVTYEEATYEGYGPGGAAIMVQVTTDNLNRTVAAIRHIFSKNGGNLGEPNSVAWLFEKRGHVYLDANRYPEDLAMEAALNAGADDMATEGEQHIITMPPGELHGVRDALQSAGIEISESEVTMTPTTQAKIEGKDAEQLLRLMDALEEHEDVSQVYSNFDIDAETLSAVGG